MRISDWSSDVCSSDLEAAGIRFEDKVREKIITFSKGLPYYAQLICLHAARHAVDRGSSAVRVEDLRNALDQILAEADPLVAAMYERATRGGRKIGRASCRERVCQYV